MKAYKYFFGRSPSAEIHLTCGSSTNHAHGRMPTRQGKLDPFARAVPLDAVGRARGKNCAETFPAGDLNLVPGGLHIFLPPKETSAYDLSFVGRQKLSGFVLTASPAFLRPDYQRGLKRRSIRR